MAAPFHVDAEEMIQRAQASFTARRPFEATWEPCRRLFLPDAPPFTLGNTTQGQRDREATIDTYGQFLLRQYAVFVYGAITGATDWIKITAHTERQNDWDGGEVDPEGLELADRTRDELQDVLMADSVGFGEQFFAMLLEYGCFGNGELYGGDRPGGLPIVRCAPIRDVALEGGAGHEPGGHWWRQRLTAAEWSRKFPKRDLGPKINEAAASPTRRNEMFTFVHGCIDNPGWSPTEIDQVPHARRYLTVWLNEDEKYLVGQNYLTSEPYTAFRAPRRAGEQYGRGRAEEALEENLMAQRLRTVGIRGVEKTVDPTMLLPDDGIMTPPTNEAEGAIVVRSDLMRGAGDPVRYLKSEARPDIAQEFLQTSVYTSMGRAFGNDLMTLPREPRMVESQIIGLQEEQARGVVPLVAPLFAPLARFIGRIYDIRRRQGRMPLPPQNGRRYQLAIEFRNPLEKAARLAEVRAFMQALTVQIQSMQVDPGARHALKVIDAVQGSARTLGVPEKWISTKKEIEQALAAGAEIANQQAGMEGMLDATTALKNVGAGMRGLQPAANDRAAA